MSIAEKGGPKPRQATAQNPAAPRAAHGKTATTCPLSSSELPPRVEDDDTRRGSRRNRDVIGRYQITRYLGSGGMSTVYVAHDPDLDRHVAVKLLRRRVSKPDRQRMVREARVLAQVSHPNVVHVYEAGIHDDDVFIAMELVKGMSFKHWCEQNPRPDWRQLRRAYIEVGRGLAAAHAQGIIHRDVKPANLLLGTDGHALVVDFGVAAASANKVVQGGDAALDADRDTNSNANWEALPSAAAKLGETLTATGTFVGTPAFMAPEQHRGIRVGPAADQYALCVAMFLSLYGTLPFGMSGSQSASELLDRKRRAELERPPGSAVPLWLHQVLARGLAMEPQDRYPSMNALVAALEDDPVERRAARARIARIALMSSVLAGAVASLVVMRLAAGTQRDNCQQMTDDLASVWSPDIRNHIRKAFAATGAPFAGEAFQRVSTHLNDYANQWLAMRMETCESAQMHEQPPAELVYLRINCLERRRTQLGVLSQFFRTETDKDLVGRAVEVAQSLPPLGECGDLAALSAVEPPPNDLATLKDLRDIEQDIDRMKMLYHAGRFRKCNALGEQVMPSVDSLDYAPIRARTLYWLGNCYDDAGRIPEAEESIRAAILAAANGKDDVWVAESWALLVWIIGVSQARQDVAIALEHALLAAIERADNDAVSGEALNNMAQVLGHAGKFREAEAMQTRALALRRRALGPQHAKVGESLNNLGMLYGMRGQFEQAKLAHEQGLAIREQVFGPHSHYVAASLNNLCLTLWSLGEYTEARAACQRAVDISRVVVGPHTINTARYLHNLALVRNSQGASEEARAIVEDVLQIETEILGTQNESVFITLSTLGDFRWYAGDLRDAEVLLKRALAVGEAIFPHDHGRMYRPMARLGRVLVHQSQTAAARPLIGRALAIAKKFYGTSDGSGDGSRHPFMAFPLLVLGELLTAEGQPGAAVEVLERAQGLEFPLFEAEIQLSLARALWQRGAARDRTRAYRLAEAARDHYQHAGNQEMQRKAAAWLTTRKAP